MKGISTFKIVLFTLFSVGALVGLLAFSMYQGSGSGSKGVGTVVIWGTLPQAGMDQVLLSAKQGNSSFKSVSYVQKDPTTLSNDLATAIATGAAPDLVLASQEELQAIDKFVTPIPLSSLPVSTFNSTFVSEGSLLAAPNNGGYYGMPFLLDPLVLFSNNAILSSDNIALPPSNWDALTGLVPNVAVYSPTKQIQRALIAMGSYSNVQNARAIISAILLQEGVPMTTYGANGGLVADLGEAQGINGVPTGEAAVRFYTQFADPSKVSYTWNQSMPGSQQAFLSGDLALYLGFASEANFFTSANPNLGFTVSPLPQISGAGTKVTYGRLYSFMVPRASPNVAGAYAVASALTGKALDLAAASATGMAPAVRSALSGAPPQDPVASIAYASALYAQGWLSPAPAATDGVFSAMISNVLSSRTTLATAVSTAQSSLSALLQQ